MSISERLPRLKASNYGTIMTLHEEMTEEYDDEKAARAIDWLLKNTTSNFRDSVNLMRFLKLNEYLWTSNINYELPRDADWPVSKR